jgi:hypothetical protein
MKKMTAAVLSATMLLSMGAALPQNLFVPNAVVSAAADAKFNEEVFYVVVGTYDGEYTQLRSFSLNGDGTYSAEKIVWKNAPADLVYGDVLIAEGNVSMERVSPAQDPINAMAYYYALDDSAKLNKVGNCSDLMEQKDLIVKRKDYDGSAHWSIRYTDESDGKEYYYGLSTYGSSLDVSPLDYNVGDICTFAMLNGNVIVPVKKVDTDIKDLAVFEEGEQMKLKDVVELSKKGSDLCWGDLAKYKGVDIGSGLFILEYDLGNGYMLHVGGTSPVISTDTEAIMYARLSHGEKTIDIRTDDVEAFIDEINSENDPTALKGTKEMTLLDVRYLALIGDSLDWSHFADYKGRDVGSGQNVWEFELPKGYVLHVCGVTGQKPSLILLSRDGEKGIDIRTDDVSAYITSKEMTLDDVIELSKKGDDLDWSDFEDFRCYDSSTCIRDWTFDLGDGFVLDVGGPFEGKPDFILLYYNSARTCDVRTEDVAGFIDEIAAKYIIVKGDANFDRHMDMADVVFIMQCLANPDKYQFTEQGRINADMDGNGVTVADARTIQMLLLGYDINEILGVDSSLIVNKLFIYEKDTNLGIYDISFGKDGKYYCHQGNLSAARDWGTWKISGNTVVLTGQFGINRFRVAETVLTYIAEGSDGFGNVKPKDGEKFYVAYESSGKNELKASSIVTIKTNYDPVMSDWSGIGILLEVDSPDCPISLRAADGHFTEWDIKTGSGAIKTVGTTYDIGKNGYIFWTPDELNYKDGFDTEIMVVGVSGDVFIDFGKIYVTQTEGGKFVASFEKDAAATDSAKLLGLKDAKIKSVNVTSLPQGYDFTFTDDKAQTFIDFLSDMELTADFSENPGELNGMTWVIKLEYENGEAMTLYDIGGFIRSESNSWFKYEYDYDSPLNTLIWELSK